MKTLLKVLSIIILCFLGFGGIMGGITLISDPSGGKFEWTLEILEGTPFKNFLIPGIILIIANGLLPLYIAVEAIRKRFFYPLFMMVQGLILIIWLTAEVLFNPALYSSLLHPIFYATGGVLLVLGAFQVKYYRK